MKLTVTCNAFEALPGEEEETMDVVLSGVSHSDVLLEIGTVTMANHLRAEGFEVVFPESQLKGIKKS